MTKHVKNEILFEHQYNALTGRIIQLICLAVIVRVSFLYPLNPLLSILVILFLAAIFFMVNEGSVVVSQDHIEIRRYHILGVYKMKRVIDLKEIDLVDYDKPGTFYPAFILGGAESARKSGSLIFKYKDGTYEKMVLHMPKSRQREMFELIEELIDQRPPLSQYIATNYSKINPGSQKS